LDRANQTAVVGHVSIVKKQPAAFRMGILDQMVYSPGIERRRPSSDSMHFVTFLQQERREIGAVLAGYASN
jgi:hypothetical protein